MPLASGMYARNSTTYIRPSGSNVSAIGSSTIGSDATNSILKPGGSLNVFSSSSGVSTGAGGMWSM